MAPRPSLPTKKRKLNSDASSSTDVASNIKTIEDQLIAAVANKASLNPLADLLDIARSAVDAQLLSKAIYALYRVFLIISMFMSSKSLGRDKKNMSLIKFIKLHEVGCALLCFARRCAGVAIPGAGELAMRLEG